MKKIYQRNYDMPPGEGPQFLKPFMALQIAAENGILMSVIPVEESPAFPDEHVAVFIVNRPDVVADDPVLRDLILEFAHNGQEQDPGSLAVATCMAAHRFAAKRLEDSD